MRYVAFLRGINVSGKNMIKMEKLRELFSSQGFDNVKSYINSGNVIFETVKSTNEKLATRIKEAIAGEFSMEISVMVRTMAEIEALINADPFEKKQKDGQDIFVVFLAEKLSAEKEKLLLDQNRPTEMFATLGPNVFCLMDHGFVDSLLGKKFIDNKLKTPATARNIRTVNKIKELLLN